MLQYYITYVTIFSLPASLVNLLAKQTRKLSIGLVWGTFSGLISLDKNLTFSSINLLKQTKKYNLSLGDVHGWKEAIYSFIRGPNWLPRTSMDEIMAWIYHDWIWLPKPLICPDISISSKANTVWTFRYVIRVVVVV